MFWLWIRMQNSRLTFPSFLAKYLWKWWPWPPVFSVPPDTAEGVQLWQQAQAYLHRRGYSQHLPCSEACKPQSLRCFPLLSERASKGSARYTPNMPLPLEVTADKRKSRVCVAWPTALYQYTPTHPVLVENCGLQDHWKHPWAIKLPRMNKDGCRAAFSVP